MYDIRTLITFDFIKNKEQYETITRARFEPIIKTFTCHVFKRTECKSRPAAHVPSIICLFL